MDRINKFLATRPVKHKKVLNYNDKKYEVTKEDLKLVRMYRSRRCLVKSFKLSRPLDLSYSATPAEALPAIEKKNNTELFIKKLRKRYAENPIRKKKAVEKNSIVDIWENENVETLANYKQEWVYSIKEAYDRPVEDCEFTKEHLEEELRRVYLKHFRPREIKKRTLEELLPKLPDCKELKPYPEAIGKEWKIEGKKQVYGRLICSAKENTVEVIDLTVNKSIATVSVEEKVRHVRATESGIVLFSTERTIYKILDGKAVPILETKKCVKDFSVSDTSMAVLSARDVSVYNVETLECTKTFLAKYESPNRVKVFNDTVYVSTANGLLIEGAEKGDIKTLNYVIDFSVTRSRRVFAINNVSRLIIIAKDNNIIKNVEQPEIGRAISAHSVLNMTAILFQNEIGIYKYVNNEYIPVHTLPGRFKTLQWHPELPWLYASKLSKVVLFT